MSHSPTKTIDVEVVTDLAEPADLAIRYHYAAQTAAAQAAHYAVLCGLELARLQSEVKALLPWKDWCAENLPFTYQTARNYQRVAEGVKGRALKGILDAGAVALLDCAPSKLDEGQRQQLLDAVGKVTGGDTLQQLYLDFGIIKKDPTKNLKKGGATHTKGRPSRKQLDAEDARQRANEFIGLLDSFLREGIHQLMEPRDLKHLDQQLLHARQTLKPLI